MKVKEIFASIQGEGPYVGYKQLFIRFCGCNLNCDYCDTEFGAEQAKDFSAQELAEIVKNNMDCHSVSLTGGEPLLGVDFLKEFLPECKLPVYLETNGTLSKNLEQVIDFVTYISADIKLPSCTGLKPLWTEHDEFFRVGAKKELFAKVVFDSNITEDEIKECAKLCKKYGVELVLQPKMIGIKPAVDSEFMIKTLDKFLTLYSRVRLIPQVHKFIDVV